MLDPGEAADYVAEQATRIVFPERVQDPLFRAAIHRSSLDNIDTMWRIIAGRADLHAAASPPLGALAFAETAAEMGVPVSQFERVYRVGVGLVWVCWYRSALEHAERTAVPVIELLGAPTLVIHTYIDALLSPMLERYDATRAETRRTREHLRRSILRQALDSPGSLEDSEVQDALGVAADVHHLAVLVQAGDSIPDELAATLRGTCDADTALTYQHGVDEWMLWLSRADEFGDAHLSRLRGALEQTGMRAVIGPSSRGGRGIGATGRDAIETARMHAMLGASVGDVLAYTDVRLEALLLGDTDRAQRFVDDELGALSGEGERLRRLRETLLAWLTTGSYVATAARLGFHEHTVRNRIVQAEELLGTSLTTRRTELLVALRLERMLRGVGAGVSPAGRRVGR